MTDAAPSFDLITWGSEHLLLLSLLASGLAVLAAALLTVAYLLLRRRRVSAAASDDLDDPGIDVASLDASPPVATGPQLEIYGTPHRVAVVVMAPAGRSGTVPPKKELPALAEFLFPNLGAVLIASQ